MADLRFQVRRTQCPTCIYKPDSPLDLQKLEGQIQDQHGHFKGYRVCHYHGDDTCCRGFYDAHRGNCTPLQVADRLGICTISNKIHKRRLR